MNRTILQGKMRRVRGNLNAEWGRLTDNDRRQLDGKIDQMVGLFQERYGYTRQKATKLLAQYMGDFGKRKPARTLDQRKMAFPVISAFGITLLLTAGWFFLTRFSAETPELAPGEMTEAEFLADSEVV
ncbi:MAG: CsbD family protein [Caldilineaceae bacterium]